MSLVEAFPRRERRVDAPGLSAAELSKLLFSAPAALRPGAVPHTLHSPETIKAILHRECARGERSGIQFCLVVIDPGSALATVQRLGELLTLEVRQSDEIGFLDDRRLCAFLPYTAPAGAQQFMARLMSRATAAGWNPVTQLFVYPSHTTEKNGTRSDRHEDNRDSDDHPRGGDGGSVSGVEEFLVSPSPWWKRMIDIVVSLMAALIFWPLMVAIGLAIKLSSRGPVFFTQWRSGLGGRPFRIYKFRTMVPDADQMKGTLQNEQDGPAFKMEHDPRVTGIGRFLRISSLDELPQLWNVLIGDMSLVGPRPLPLNESLKCDTWHRRRLDVVPGLTCTWQIRGRGTVSFAEWVRMDRNYIQRRSLIHDVKLLALTVPAVLARRGAK